MKILCSLFGHRISTSQVWAGKEERDGDGVWLPLRAFCPRCFESVAAGSLFISDRAAIAAAQGAA